MARILIIDDDDTLRGIIVKSLTYAGHQVTQTNNGRKGVELFRSDPTDLVITDMVMPEQEGMETIKILHREFPQLRIIAMSGGGHGAAEHYLQVAGVSGANAMIRKPFSPDALIELVKTQLAVKALPGAP